ncbi:MAG: elongation factor P [Chloroflexota bacterium]
MIDVNQLRRGTCFTIDGDLFKVQEYEHRKPGRGKATIKVNVKNMRSGSNTLMTFTSGDRVEDVRLEKRQVQYLYNDGDNYVFMDSTTYVQSFVPHHVFGSDRLFLRENMDLEILTYEEIEVLDYILPKSMEFDVVEAENAVAGDTATGASKEVITDTGLKVKTPLFVKQGDRIKVNTETGDYITRV